MTDALILAYVMSMTFCITAVISALFSKKAARFLGVKCWTEFVTGIIVGLVPVLNTMVVLVCIFDMLPNLPTPEAWKK